MRKAPPSILQYWNRPAREYARSLWSPLDNAGFEPTFRHALVDELALRGCMDPDALVSEIEASGAVLTAHHVCPTNGPTFGAMDHLACLGRSGAILVLAWSGVAMSNTAASGALCFSRAKLDDLLRAGSQELKKQQAAQEARRRDGTLEGRVTLIPAAMRDALVYEFEVPDRVHEVLAAATPALRQLIAEPQRTENYAQWALRVNESIQRKILARTNLWYVDLNRVATRYLLAILQDDQHPLTKLLSSADHADAVCAALPSLPWFYARKPDGRSKVVPVYGTLPNLGERLATSELCPGIVPVLGALRMLSRMRLLGGVRQTEYLEHIATVLAADMPSAHGIPTSLLTGRWVCDSGPIHPLDLALGTADPSEVPSSNTPMSSYWRPIFGG